METKKNAFLYETHLHTSEGSTCANCPATELVQCYKAAGYDGIVITDHFFYGNTTVDRSLPWKAWVERHCLGFERAKAEGERIGLQVFYGWESNYNGVEFLIYGLDKQWLLEHPEIKDASVEEQYELVHNAGGIVCHAHPFREEPYIPEIILYPGYVDAVETINATHTSPVAIYHRNPEYNVLATEYAQKHKLPMMAGSDQHSRAMIGGGMIFNRKIRDIHDLCKAIVEEETVAMLDGVRSIPYEKSRKTESEV